MFFQLWFFGGVYWFVGIIPVSGLVFGLDVLMFDFFPSLLLSSCILMALSLPLHKIVDNNMVTKRSQYELYEMR